MRYLAAVVLICLASAQSPPDVVSEQRLRADLQYLCSPKLEGRLSLSPGADAAANYIASEFRKAGLEPAAAGWLQQFPLVAWEPDRASTELTLVRDGRRTTFRSVTDFRGGSWRDQAIAAPVVFAGFGITAPEYGYDDYAGVDARGKIVLLFDHEPQETEAHSIFNGTGHTRHATSRVKVENARRHGAVAVLLASEPLRKHAGIFSASTRGTGTTSLRATAPRQSIDEDSIPLFQISDAVAANLLRTTGRTPAELQESIDGRRTPSPANSVSPVASRKSLPHASAHPFSTPLANTTVELKTAASSVRRAQSANVVGVLEGSDSALRGETVLLTAHYDHLGTQNGRLYPGANDNASGSVGVMELARLFSKAAHPKRSLLFVVFGSEEEGLLGSYYYVAHPLRPLATTRAVINLDMIARDEAHIPQSKGVVEIPADTHNELNLVGVFYSADLRAVIEKANAHTKLDLSTKFDRDHDLNALFRCDHFPFLLHDVPAVWLFGGWHPGYHEPSDTIDRLNFAKLEKVVSLAYLTARRIADSDAPPRFTAR